MKKIPMRTCLVTREKLPKKDLIRLVRTKEGEVFLDMTGKMNGHGVYLKKDVGVIKKVKSNKLLERVLNSEVSNEVYEQLEEIVNK